MAQVKKDKGYSLYGGIPNPAKLDLVAFSLGSNCMSDGRRRGERLFALTVINHTAADYLFFGLGKNGYQKPEYFWSAVEFFFRTRSWAPHTWEDAPIIDETVRDPDNGKIVRYVIKPEPETLKLQCFDQYFDISGLSKEIAIDRFLDDLKARRTKLILDNREQIRSYLEYCQVKRLRAGRQKGQLEFAMEPEDFLDILVCPTDPEQLEAIVAPIYHVDCTSPRIKAKACNKPNRTVYKQPGLVIGQQEFLLEGLSCEQLSNS